MKKINRLFCLLLPVLSLACENELPFHDSPQEPRLVMNAFLRTDTARNVVSLSVLHDSEAVPAGEGTVTVYVGDKPVETADVRRSSPFAGTVSCTLATPFRPGDRVRLSAVAEEGRYRADAEVVIPQPIERIMRVDTMRTTLKIGTSMSDCLRYRITIPDRPGERNYYRLVIEKRTYRTNEEGVTYGPLIETPEIINQEDVVLTEGHLTTADDKEFGAFDMTIPNVRNIFTDSRFADASYTLNVYTAYPGTLDWSSDSWKYHTRIDAVIRLQSITEAQYRYMRALNCLDSDNYSDTFMEPVIVPQNVTGGLGFVGASSEQQVTLRIIDRPPLSFGEPS